MSEERYVLSAIPDSKYKLVLDWSYFGDAKSYEVLYDGKLYVTSSTKMTFTGVTPGEHSYQVRAILADSVPDVWSSACPVNMRDVTDPVMGSISVSVSGGTATVYFSAKDNVGIDHYLVECDAIRVTSTDNQVVFSDLLVGRHSLTVVAYDAAGNISKVATKKFPVADYRPPEQVTQLGSEGVITNKSGGYLTWGIPYDDSGKISRYTVTVDGKEYTTSRNSLKIKGLSAGEHHFTVTARDAAGFTSVVSEAGSFWVTDVIKPKLGSLNKVVNGVNVELNWSGSDETGIDHYVVSSVLGEAVVQAGKIALTFAPEHVGTQKITVVAFDAAGNASSAKSCTVKIADVTPPDAVTGLQAGIVTNKSGGELVWDIPYDNSGKITRYRVALDGKVYNVSTNKCRISKLSAGEHTYTVVARDANGWWSPVSEPGTFTVLDVIAPKIGKCYAAVNGYEVRLSCTGTDETGIAGYVISWASGLVTSETGETAITFSETDIGKQKITIAAMDAAGNVSSKKTLTVTIADTTAPEKVTGGGSKLFDNKSGGVLMWEVPFDNSGKLGKYTVQVDDGKIYRVSTNELKLKAMSAGEHYFTVIATDKDDNASQVSEKIKFTVADVIDPVIKNWSVKVSGNTAAVAWTATDETSSVLRAELWLDGVQVAGTVEDCWLLEDLSVGRHSLELQVFDEAGNMVAKSRDFTSKEPVAAGVDTLADLWIADTAAALLTGVDEDRSVAIGMLA
ncbi:MAG: hypothetical protein IJC73_03650 [Lentisphaeria bacterium]|nr:hypothetical protein [Lentisphaeria bacterium]